MAALVGAKCAEIDAIAGGDAPRRCTSQPGSRAAEAEPDVDERWITARERCTLVDEPG
jgi:hypothetical protein